MGAGTKQKRAIHEGRDTRSHKEASAVRLIPIESVQGAAYNPRKRVGERYEALKESLNFFGWLIPAFINEKGILLSGHQRTNAWRELGYNQIPVITVSGLSEDKERGLNILFNMATNDMKRIDESSDLWKKFSGRKGLRKAKNRFSCMEITMESAEKLARENEISSNEDGWQYAASLLGSGIIVPIVVGNDNRIANGGKRLACYLRQGLKKVPVVKAEHPSDVISGYLNFISMDFDVKSTYSKELRFGSFRRPRLNRTHFGHGFSAWVNFREFQRTEDFDHTIPANQKALRERFGLKVVDFGAGHLHETIMLRKAGITVFPFEPYHVVGNKPSLNASRKICREFLKGVSEGINFSSFVLSSVFNSVPFEEDREDILRIAASLGSPVYICTMGYTAPQTFLFKKTEAIRSERIVLQKQMPGNYEPGIIIGELSTGNPKAQKFFKADELMAFVRKYFRDVRGFSGAHNIYLRALNPVNVPRKELIESLEREFNLPYPDNQSLGLVEEAIEAWKCRGVL